ncbi:bacteriocin biosynthesis cyclodehydratase domain-containing protein [Agromyces flavus]|uniref:Bacteriocin biosynthesis cyclodehydratase domain-containing protein n=1 Tax=Agromyces flavus TaxID=589382 RepID=A0A1H1NNI3_9MICO|nr:bacteriocin biosynthesis cyclodehydratase domain-containing protein [Agromyces flavus]SDS00275.1 bacteriocin biosynthesis cyclodehydratase domain-containing protein [Agromyces flavus]
MTPRLDPALPHVWRSPRELQLGGARPVAVLPDPGPAELGVLRALISGASVSTLRTIGTALGASETEVDALLDRLAPAFATEPARSTSARVALAGDRDVVDPLASLLVRLGHRPAHAAPADPAEIDVAVLVGAWVIAPAAHLPWLSADLPHLAVVLDEGGVEIGPLVRPGHGPCLRCLHLWRRDADASWPAIAAQLSVAPPPPRSARAEHEALALAASVVDDLARTRRTALDAAVVRVSGAAGSHPPALRPIGAHPECGCRAPAGTATAPARLDARRPAPPSSASAAAVPA